MAEPLQSCASQLRAGALREQSGEAPTPPLHASVAPLSLMLGSFSAASSSFRRVPRNRCPAAQLRGSPFTLPLLVTNSPLAPPTLQVASSPSNPAISWPQPPPPPQPLSWLGFLKLSDPPIPALQQPQESGHSLPLQPPPPPVYPGSWAHLSFLIPLSASQPPLRSGWVSILLMVP